MPPRDKLVHVRLRESVLRSKRLPTLRRIVHSTLQWKRSTRPRPLPFHAEIRGNLRPKPAPPEQVAVRNVVRLPMRRRGARGPCELLREHPRVRDIGQCVPLLMRTRKDERLTALAIQRGIYSERLAHVHRVARRVADDGVGAMHRPCEAIGGSCAKQRILLRVVEVQALAVAACFRGREFPPRFARTPQRDPGSASFRSQAPHAAAACLAARRTGSRSSRRSPRRSPLRSTVEATNRRTHESARCRQARQPGCCDRSRSAASGITPRAEMACAQAHTRSSPAPPAETPGCHLRFLCCPQSTLRDLCSCSSRTCHIVLCLSIERENAAGTNGCVGSAQPLSLRAAIQSSNRFTAAAPVNPSLLRAKQI